MGIDDEGALGKPVKSDPQAATERSNRRNQVIIAVIGAVAAIFVALIYAMPWHHDNLCATNLSITSPSDGYSVENGAQGVKVTGTACGMTKKTGWLFDYDPNDGYYYLDYSTSLPSPVAVANGSWAYYDAPVGSKGDENQTYQITVVLASQMCTGELERARPDFAGDYRFRNLPAGCQIQDTVAVVVTYPDSG